MGNVQDKVLAASTAAFVGYTLEEALIGVARSGYSHVEIACIQGYIEHVPQELMTPSYATKIRRTLESLGLKTYAFSAHMDLTAEGAADIFRNRMRFASDLGVKVIITNISRPHVRKVFIERLASCVPLATELGIVVGIEAPGTLLPTPTEYDQLLRTIDSEAIMLNFDLGNVFTASLGRVDPFSELLRVLDRVVHLHVKDVWFEGDVWRFSPVGEGSIPYGDIFTWYAEQGARLPLTVEMPLSLEGRGSAPAYLRDECLPWDEIVAGLARSRRFIANSMNIDPLT